MSKRNRQKREVNTVWRDYTSKLLELLRSEAASEIMLEESHILGMIASSPTPEEHLRRVKRHINWFNTPPTEPELLKIYEDSDDNALEHWIHQLQPSGITRQAMAQAEIARDFANMDKPMPPLVFGMSGRSR